MGRLEKLKRQAMLDANISNLNEQVIDPQEYPLHMDKPQPQDNTMVDTPMPEPPNFKVSKPLPDCAKLFQQQAIDEFRKQKDKRMGPVTLDIGNVTLKVVTGPVSPNYEGVYLTKDGDTEQFCKFNFK